LQIINHKLVEVGYTELTYSNLILSPFYIAAHYTGVTSVNGSLTHLTTLKLSYHVIIDRNGTITQCVPFNKRARHAGVSNWKGLSGLNDHSIGICLANRGYVSRFSNGSYGWVDTHNTPIGSFLTEEQVVKAEHFNGAETNLYWEKYTTEQLNAFREICQILIQTYTGIRDLVGHDEIAMGRKPDPGPAFPFTDFYPLFTNRGNDKGNKFKVQTTDGKLNVRRGMSGNFKLLRQLVNGNKVHIRSEGYMYEENIPKPNGWVSISLEGIMDHIGYVNKSFLIAV